MAAVLSDLQIEQVRAIARLEALRAAALSVASEAFDDHIVSVTVTMALEGESIVGTIVYFDARGHTVTGGDL